MASPVQPPLDYSRFNPRASGIPQYGSEEEAQEALKWAAIEAGLMAFPYGKAYKYGKSAYEAGLPGLKAQWASRKGSAAIPKRDFLGDEYSIAQNRLASSIGDKSLGKTVDDLFVKNPGYHGTEYPHFFEKGSKGIEGGVKIPTEAQIGGSAKAPTFSISSSKRFADVFAGKGDDAISRGDIRRTIPVLIDKKSTGKVLDFRNPSHNKYIKNEFKKFRKDLRKDLEEKVVPNTKMYDKALKTFDKSTAEDLARLDNPNTTNWHIIEKIVPQLKERGWKAFTTVEGEKLNLQIIDPKIIRAYRNEAGEIVNKMNEGGKVPGGGIGNFVAENLRKKQVTVHKPSKSLVKQGYSPEARLKARYKNTSYFG
jgi:hypothetical protein